MKEHVEPLAQQAVDNESEAWKEQYLELAVEFLQRNEYFRGSELSKYCRKKGLGNPHHHNVWVSISL